MQGMPASASLRTRAAASPAGARWRRSFCGPRRSSSSSRSPPTRVIRTRRPAPTAQPEDQRSPTGSARWARRARARSSSSSARSAWAIPLELVLLGIPFVRGKRSLITPARLAIDFLVVVIAASHRAGRVARQARVRAAPGERVIGELFGEIARSLFSTIGSFLVGFACLGLLLIARASFSFIAMMNWLGQLGREGGARHGGRRALRRARHGRRRARSSARSAKRSGSRSLPHIDAPNRTKELSSPSRRDESPAADRTWISRPSCVANGPTPNRREPTPKRERARSASPRLPRRPKCSTR